MLSRVADSLYWMSRYLERAEHTARVINIQLNLMLERGSQSDDLDWARVGRSLGMESRRTMTSGARRAWLNRCCTTRPTVLRSSPAS